MQLCFMAKTLLDLILKTQRCFQIFPIDIGKRAKITAVQRSQGLGKSQIWTLQCLSTHFNENHFASDCSGLSVCDCPLSSPGRFCSGFAVVRSSSSWLTVKKPGAFWTLQGHVTPIAEPRCVVVLALREVWGSAGLLWYLQDEEM